MPQTSARLRTPRPAAHGKNRNALLAALNITWKQVRPDLHGDEEALRGERLAFAADVLNLPALDSFSTLTDAQLGRVLDQMRRRAGQTPPTAATATVSRIGEPAQVIHLVTREQTHTIDKLFDHLGWDAVWRAGFVAKRCRRSAAMLTPVQARGLIAILLTIAADRDLRARGAKRVSRVAIHKHIPVLKHQLGIN